MTTSTIRRKYNNTKYRLESMISVTVTLLLSSLLFSNSYFSIRRQLSIKSLLLPLTARTKVSFCAIIILYLCLFSTRRIGSTSTSNNSSNDNNNNYIINTKEQNDNNNYSSIFFVMAFNPSILSSFQPSSSSSSKKKESRYFFSESLLPPLKPIISTLSTTTTTNGNSNHPYFDTTHRYNNNNNNYKSNNNNHNNPHNVYNKIFEHPIIDYDDSFDNDNYINADDDRRLYNNLDDGSDLIIDYLFQDYYSNSRPVRVPSSSSVRTKTTASLYDSKQQQLQHRHQLQLSSSSSLLSSSYSHNVYTSPLHVTYTNDPKIVSKWLSDHIPSSGCVLGFDVETVPTTKWSRFPSVTSSSLLSQRGPSVVQLATVDSAIVIHLVRGNGKGNSMACVPILQSILNDEKIVKVGVSIDQDMIDLMDWNKSLIGKSRFELGRLRERKRSDTPGLKTLTASILGLYLPKSRKVSTSNWNTVPLSYTQLSYSARDAWVSAAIINELQYRDVLTFGTEKLIQQLQSQEISIEILHQRYTKRKYAKILLSTLVLPYTEDGIFNNNKNNNNGNNSIFFDFGSSFNLHQQQKQQTSSSQTKLKSSLSSASILTQPHAATPPKGNKKEKKYTTKYPLPGWKATIVKELKQILNTNIHEKTEIFDIRRLGLQLLTGSTIRPIPSSSSMMIPAVATATNSTIF